MWPGGIGRIVLGISIVSAIGLASQVAGGGAFADAADYDSLMRDAVGLRRSGDDASALKLFEQAYELNKTPKALAQIGLAEQALGRWSAADKNLRQALESGDDPWIKKNRPAIEQSLDIIAAHVGQLDVSGKPAGADVRVDGELVGQLPLARPVTVTAGGVAIEVSARGHVPIVRSATVRARTLTREIFSLQSLAPVAEPVTATQPQPQPQPSSGSIDAVALREPPSKNGPGVDAGERSGGSSSVATPAAAAGSSRLPLVLAAGGLSVASLAFGVIEHLSWQSKVTSFGSNGGCGTTFPDKGAPGCQGLYDDGQHAKIRAFVGYGLAAAFAATAVVLHFTDSGGSSEPSRVACAPDFMTAGLGCALGF
jgi:hypothetical protein